MHATPVIAYCTCAGSTLKVLKIFQVVAEAVPWVGGTVAISNFGFGGTNVHCLVSGRARARAPAKALPAPCPVPAALDAPAAGALDPTVGAWRLALGFWRLALAGSL